MLELLLRFIKFGFVGASGLIIDFGITFFLKEKVKVQKYLANAIGFISAASSNYLLNRIWTWQSNNPEVLNEYLSFVIVSIIGLGINSLALWILVSKFKRQFYFAKFLAIVITTLWNFAGYSLITFA